MSEFSIQIATEEHISFAELICDHYAESAVKRGTGIAKRSPDYIRSKILENKGIIALHVDGSFAGFCYIESWQDHNYVANSGLIVSEKYRNKGLAKEIKNKAFEQSRTLFPEAKIFGLTTSLAVMKINSKLGYRPVTFSELTADDTFWEGCKSCVNYDILNRTGRKLCLCTGMLFDPSWYAKVDGAAPKESEPEKNENLRGFLNILNVKKEAKLRFNKLLNFEVYKKLKSNKSKSIKWKRWL